MLQNMENDQFLQEILENNYHQRIQQLKSLVDLQETQNKGKTQKAYKCIVDSINFESGQKIIRLYNKDFERQKKASYVLSPRPFNFYNNKFKTSRLKELYGCNFKSLLKKDKKWKSCKPNHANFLDQDSPLHLPPISKFLKSPENKNLKRSSVQNSPRKCNNMIFGNRSNIDLHVQGTSQIPLYINRDKSKHLYDCFCGDDFNHQCEAGEENFGELEENIDI
ncbi:unnamed protein product [Blepharisma stoltei]|uniref:Protein TIC 214 n=1 Tax=Blepharisma stoltei TaxID=1481888 RepID=A0AAU9J679_9CILI|nr:unnamed protein product [Blepharisma stoltei]